MIKFNDIKIGDYLIATHGGKNWSGEVVDLNGDEKQVCVLTEVQEFWFDPKDLQAIPLSHDQMLQLSFTAHENEDGSVKYSKGAFRMISPEKDDFSSIEMWYREDIRQHPDVHYVHQLQNQFHDMTKVHLTRDPL